MITSQTSSSDPFLIPLQPTDVSDGVLHAVSYLRPTYVYTVEASRIRRKVGELDAQITEIALERIR
jgi:hypothetical protein